MFLKMRADDGGDRSPFGSFWFNPLPFTGTNVTSDSALRLISVYACTRVISEDVGKLPFVLYRRAANGGKNKITDHWLYRLFGREPNGFQNPMEFKEMMQAHLCLRGNAYAQIIGNAAGEVTQLIPIHPDRVTIEKLSEINWRYRIKNGDGSDTILTRAQIFHLRGGSADGIVGLNPIACAREAITGALAAQSYGMRYFLNDASTGQWIEFPGQFKDDAQKKQFRQAWQEAQTGANKAKTAIMDNGMKLHQLPLNNADAQFIESKKFNRSEIASLFRIPPHKIGDLEKATFSNIEQQSLEYVTDSLTPWLVRWEEAIRYYFIFEDDLDVEINVMPLLRGDSGARSTYYHKGILDGWMTRNEARINESLNPIDGLDEPLRPLNMVEENQAEALETIPDGDTPAPNGARRVIPKKSLSKTLAPADARLMALASAAAERIARKEIEECTKACKSANRDEALLSVYEKHASFVSSALNVSMATAQNYCAEQCAAMKIYHDQKTSLADINDLTRCKLERLAVTPITKE